MKRFPPGYYPAKFAALRLAWGGRCVVCGGDIDTDLNFAHLPGKPTPLSSSNGRGQSRRYHDIRRHPNHYVLLCVECHTKLDRGESLG